MILDVEDLGFSYDGRTKILDGVGFRASPGEITAIIGANGAGKTTMLKCVAGLAKHDGKVLFDGQEKDRKETVKILSYMQQNTDCDIELNVFEVVLLGMRQSLSYVLTKEDVRKVKNVLRLLRIDQFASRRIGEISGGQRQLVFIAQALIKEPKVMMLDEPTSALDLYHQFKLMEFIRKVTKDRQCTTVVTMHHLDIALRFADRLVVINDGKVYAEGPTEEVFTEDMLRDVYRMDATIETDDKGIKQIKINGTLDPEEDGSFY